MKLGARQLTVLLRIADPRFLLVVPCTTTRSLIKRGLAVSLSGDDAFIRITPAGFRVLGEALEAGLFDGEPRELKPTIAIAASSFFKNKKPQAPEDGGEDASS